jgi:hypothetical protein
MDRIQGLENGPTPARNTAKMGRHFMFRGFFIVQMMYP